MNIKNFLQKTNFVLYLSVVVLIGTCSLGTDIEELKRIYGGVLINAETPVISSHPVGANYDLNDTASELTVQASVEDGGTLTYQWYSNNTNSNSGGTLIPDAEDPDYTPPTDTDGTFFYYVVVTNTNNDVNGTPTSNAVSNVATIIITDPDLVNAETPVISSHPVGANYDLNDTANELTVQASVEDGGTLTYQWYSNSSNSNSGGTLIPDAEDPDYTPPTDTDGTFYYYVVVTNTNNDVNGIKIANTASNVAIVTVADTSGHDIEIAIPEGGVIININTQAELESIRSHIGNPAFNHGRNAYILQNDITLSGTWTPIGYVETVNTYGDPTGGINAFNGNFYGNGKTIKNLVLPGGSIHFIGLFGYIEDALIQDLQVELGLNEITVTNSSGQHLGIIAGGHKNSIIRNCGVYSTSGIVINGTSNYHVSFGGISNSRVKDNNSLIENCYVKMNITVTNAGTHIVVGGIVNNNSNIIKNCYFIGNITGTGQANADLHGLTAGEDASTVTMSYSIGKIINNATTSGYTSASGLGRHGTINNCATLMESINVTANSNYARIQRDHHSSFSSLSNNYAFSGMLLNSSTVTSNNADSIHGLDKTAAQLKQRSTYEDGLGWDFDDIWEMGPAHYPFPILKWQNGVVKLPPDFTVIQDEADNNSFNVSNPAEFASALTAIQNSSSESFTITVISDLSLGPQSLSGAAYANKTITIQGNNSARKISLSSNGSLFTVGANVELVLENIVLEGRNANNASLVRVNKDGKLVLNNGGKVTGNTFITNVNNTGGAGIFVDEGTLEIAGGEVSGNTLNGTVSSSRGGGIYALNSSIIMISGTIKENTIATVQPSVNSDATGGGIALYNSSFNMSGGFIESNTVSCISPNQFGAASGGGVSLHNNSVFYFESGTIRNNLCDSASPNTYGGSFGGGVHVDSAVFYMSGGVISGNNVSSNINPNKSYGTGGMYIDGAYGGGVYSNDFGNTTSIFIKTGGIIYGNNAVGNDVDGFPLKNTAQNDGNGLGGGHAVFYDNSLSLAQKLRRNTTAYEANDMDNSISGATGGWE